MSSSHSAYTEYDRVLNCISERLKSFDFESFDKKLRLNQMIEDEKPKVINHLTDISFDDLKNIKF